MNLILLEHEEIDRRPGPTLRLDDRRAEHLRTVLGVQPGSEIKVGVINGPLGSAEVVAVDSDGVDLSLDLNAMKLPPKPRTTLILAMVRPQIMKRTLQHVAALGVREILLVGSRRVEKSYFSQRLFDGDEYEEYLKLGLEQACDTWMPQVSIHRRFRPFVEDVLASRVQEYTHRIIAHPGGAFRARPLSDQGRVVVAIGPEGGWIDYEVERFEELGFERRSLGPRILKVETALPYLFGALGLS